MQNLNYDLTSAGMKLYDGNKHVKTISSKYKDVFRKVLFDFTKKRPTENERKSLENELFKVELDSYHNYLAKYEKYIYELIQDATVVNVQRVETKSETRLELIYDNGTRVRCSLNLYSLFSEKLEKRFSNY